MRIINLDRYQTKGAGKEDTREIGDEEAILSQR